MKALRRTQAFCGGRLSSGLEFGNFNLDLSLSCTMHVVCLNTARLIFQRSPLWNKPKQSAKGFRNLRPETQETANPKTGNGKS